MRKHGMAVTWLSIAIFTQFAFVALTGATAYADRVESKAEENININDISITLNLKSCTPFYQSVYRQVEATAPDDAPLLDRSFSMAILEKAAFLANQHCPIDEEFQYSNINVHIYQKGQVRIWAKSGDNWGDWKRKQKESSAPTMPKVGQKYSNNIWGTYDVKEFESTELDKLFLKAVETGDASLAISLVKKGADINTRNAFALHYISENVGGNRKKENALLLQELLKNGIIVSSPTGAELLSKVARIGDLETVRLLTARMDLRLDDISWQPMCDATQNGHIKIVDHFLRNLANLEVTSRYSGQQGDRPLHIAVKQKNVNMVKFLLSAGADINAKGFWGNTPLAIAASSGSPFGGGPKESKEKKEMVRLLLQAGADPNIKMDQGRTAYDLARDEEIKKIILKAQTEKALGN